MAYATLNDIKDRMTRTLTPAEETVCTTLLDDAAILIDSYNQNANEEAKKIVTCRIIIRAIGDGSASIPIGATQGSKTALSYSESWTISNGSVGELYLSRTEKKLLGAGDKIGSYSPIQELVGGFVCEE